MKRTKVLVASVLITLGIGTSAKAALPMNSIIIGKSAYNVDYMVKHVQKFNDILNNLSYYGDMYYYDGSSIKSLFTGSVKLENDVHDSSGVDTILYYDEAGNKQSYVFNKDSNSYNADSPVGNVSIVVTSALGYSVINVKVSNVDALPSALDPTYFQIISQNAAYDFSDMIKKIGTKTATGKDDDYQITLTVPTGTPVKLAILSADKNVIATSAGNLNIGYTNTDPVPLVTNNQSESTPDKNGNAAGNVNNNGMLATDSMSDDNWIYYSNLADGGSIYKKNLKGIENYKICVDSARFINVVGDWIYYSNYSDGQKIYKIRKDGTKRRIVCQDQASNLVVSGEYIYYINHKDVGVSNIGKIYKVKIDSISGTAPIGQKVTEDEAEYINVVGDVIYFRNRSEKGALYSVHTDGNYRSKILSQNPRYITIQGNYIYYISDEADLHRVSLTGTGDVKIEVQRNESTTTLKPPKLSGMNICNNTIYYWDNSDGNKLYRGTLPATGDTKQSVVGEKLVNTNLVDSVNVAKGNVYFTIGSKLSIANEPKLSGKDRTGNNLFTYSATAVVATKPTTKIISYDKVAKPLRPIDGPVSNIEEYIPDKVTAVMSDGSVREVLVDWDLHPKEDKGGKKTYTGVIVEGGQAVKFVMDLYSAPLTDENFESNSIVNNAGDANDTIEVKDLTDGDIITAYSDKNRSKVLGRATAVNRRAKITVSGDNVFPDSPNYSDTETEGKVWFTRKSKGTMESNVFGKAIPPVGASIPLDTSCPITIMNYAERLDKDETSDDQIRIGELAGVVNNGTAKLNDGDVIKVYRANGAARGELIATQVVEKVVTQNGPFIPPTITGKVDITLSGTNILHNNKPTVDGDIMITRTSRGSGESEPMVIDIRSTRTDNKITVKKDLPLQYNIVATDISGLLNNGKANIVLPMSDMGAGYEYYYMIDGTDPQYTYGATFTAGILWNKATDPSKEIFLDPTTLHTIRAVEVYGGKVIRCGSTEVQVINDPVRLSQSTAVGKTFITGLKPNTSYAYMIDANPTAASVAGTTATSTAAGTIEIDANIGQYVHIIDNTATTPAYTLSNSSKIVAGDIKPAEAPNASIKFEDETITGLGSGADYEWTDNLNSPWTAVPAGESVTSYIPVRGTSNLYIRKKAQAGKPAGTPQPINIVARSAKPNASSITSGATEVTLAGLTRSAMYEYKVDSATSWVGITADTFGKVNISAISGNIVHIRLKAVPARSFASETQDINIP